MLSARRPGRALPTADAAGVPAPGGGGVAVRVRAGLNTVFNETAFAEAAPNGSAAGDRHPAGDQDEPRREGLDPGQSGQTPPGC